MDTRLKKYAELAVVKGVNLKKGQYLVISCPVSAFDFARLCVEEAYKHGASYVELRYSDDESSKMTYTHVSEEVLKEVPDWQIARQRNSIDKKCAYLYIISDKPGLFKDIDSNKMQNIQRELYKAMDQFEYYTRNNHGQWSIVAIPNPVWAKLVFKDLSEDAAMEALWEAIFEACRVSHDNNPIELWDMHNAEMSKRVEKMNGYHFKSLYFNNDLGTDLVVELNAKHIWRGGCDVTLDNHEFNPNMPTEEVFSMPKRTGVNGKVYATKPLNYQGKLIEDFYIEFKDGKAIKWEAKNGKDALNSLISLDEGSSYLGEVALICHDSPISNMNILFMNTLFDENASCHLALGSAYPTNMVNGENMSKEELIQNDCNVSMTHVDFMFGSSCMKVIGELEDGSKVTVFEKGNFTF